MTCLAPSTLDNIFKDEEVLLPQGGERRGETCLGSLHVSPSDPVKTFQTRLPGCLGHSPGWGWEDATTGAGCLGCLRIPGPLSHLKPRRMPGLAVRPGRILSLLLHPQPPAPRPWRGLGGYSSWQGWGRAEAGARERDGLGAPELQTAPLWLRVSGPSLEAIINLRFIFIGELGSRLTLAKQGSSSRPWMRLNAGEYFCRKALQSRLL